MTMWRFNGPLGRMPRARTRERTSSIEALANAWAGIAEEAPREADDPNAKPSAREEVIPAMRERIERARDKPC